jgi:hypothetical protein
VLSLGSNTVKIVNKLLLNVFVALKTFKTFNRVWLLASLAIILFIFWVFLTLFLAPTYQNVAASDPLAMINVLFPSFWIIIGFFVGICILVFMQHGVPKYLHIMLIAQLALMLYYTPFLLSGFSWSPDSLWHGGLASYMPEIYSGASVTIGDYAATYPLMYAVTYIVEAGTGVNVFIYSLYIYPIVCTILFAGLSYFFAYRLFDSKIAFLALLIALPALHYVEMHVSPFSFGTLVLLCGLILSTYKSPSAKALTVLAILLLALTHPISPLMLAVYFFSFVFVNIAFKRNINPEVKQLTLRAFTYLLFTLISWAIWTAYASTVYIGVRSAVSSILTLNFLSRMFAVSDFTVGGAGFIYPWIQNLGLAIYGIIFILLISGRLPSFSELKGFFKAKIRKISSIRLVLMCASIIFAAMGFLLFLSSGERFLLGRGLLYFVFMGSLVIATYIVSESPKWFSVKIILAFCLIVFLVFTYPVVSYSKEAYNTFTPSADSGLRFLSSRIVLSQYSYSSSSMQQLASYVDLTKDLDLRPFPGNLSRVRPDVVAMRINGYFLVSMRNDLSFTNNGFTKLNSDLDASFDYNKVYSNSKFEVYVREP